MTKRFNLYLGRAGHLMAMSEFLMRGWNVAIPEVDVGDDIFVVEDKSGILKRVQVKTSKTIKKKEVYKAQFQIPLNQLLDIRDTMLYYVFIVRIENKWALLLIISQRTLLDLYTDKNLGSTYNNKINLHFSYLDEGVSCSGENLTKFISDFTDFPLIEQ
jgi:hypothetical protein